MSFAGLNQTPVATSFLMGERLFVDNPLTLVDVGARGGIPLEWAIFGDQMRAVGFEPNQDECARLNEDGRSNIRYLPYALDEYAREREFFIAKAGPSCGFYPYKKSSLDRCFDAHTAEIGLGDQWT